MMDKLFAEKIKEKKVESLVTLCKSAIEAFNEYDKYKCNSCITQMLNVARMIDNTAQLKILLKCKFIF